MEKILKNYGFSLIEIMIAIAVISVGVLGIATVSNSVIKGNSLSGNRSEAIFLAQDKIEELINIDFNHNQLLDDGTAGDLTQTDSPDHINANPEIAYAAGDAYPVNTAIDPSGNTATPDSRYTRFWNIEDTTATLKTIAVTVTWSDQYGPQSITLTTMKAQ